MPPEAYIICSTARSGTTLLCAMLAETGVAGRPDSFFRQVSLSDWATDWGLAPGGGIDAAYLAATIEEGRGGTDLFGMRLMAPDRAPACAALGRLHPAARSDAARIEAAFRRTAFIHLSRADKLAQAVSLIRAEQSGLWHRNADGSVREELEGEGTQGFDAPRIAAQIARLTELDAGWRAWFVREGLTPLTLTYEELAADPTGTLARVLAHVGRDPARAAGVAPPTRQLRDAVSAAWIARFRGVPTGG